MFDGEQGAGEGEREGELDRNGYTMHVWEHNPTIETISTAVRTHHQQQSPNHPSGYIILTERYARDRKRAKHIVCVQIRI